MTGSRRKILGKMKKVRIIYNDPDATDSSSDEGSNEQKNEFGQRVKRVVREVLIPLDNSSQGSQMSVGVECTEKIKGVRKREGGKFAAEIRDTIRKKKIWIGTFATVAEAHKAYKIKEAELNRNMIALNEKNFNAGSSCASEKTTVLGSGPSQDVVDNVQESTNDTIRLMNEPVLVDELPNAELEVDPILSPLPDQCSQSNPCDSKELTVKELSDDYPFESLNFHEPVVFSEEDQLQQLIDSLPAPRRAAWDFELGEEELEWLESL